MKEFYKTVLAMVVITVIVFAGMILFAAAMPYLSEFIQASHIGMVAMIPVGIVVGAVFSFLLMKLAECVANDMQGMFSNCSSLTSVNATNAE